MNVSKEQSGNSGKRKIRSGEDRYTPLYAEYIRLCKGSVQDFVNQLKLQHRNYAASLKQKFSRIVTDIIFNIVDALDCKNPDTEAVAREFHLFDDLEFEDIFDFGIASSSALMQRTIRGVSLTPHHAHTKLVSLLLPNVATHGKNKSAWKESLQQLGTFCLGTHAEMSHPYLNLPFMVIMQVLDGDQFWRKMEMLPTFYARLQHVNDRARQAYRNSETVFAEINAHPEVLFDLQGKVRMLAEITASHFFDAAQAQKDLGNITEAVILCNASLKLLDRLQAATTKKIEIGIPKGMRGDVENFRNALIGKPLLSKL